VEHEEVTSQKSKGSRGVGWGELTNGNEGVVRKKFQSLSHSKVTTESSVHCRSQKARRKEFKHFTVENYKCLRRCSLT
jgi:hypothetical protein